MIYKACAVLGVWPLSRVIKVDDAEASNFPPRNADLGIGVTYSLARKVYGDASVD